MRHFLIDTDTASDDAVALLMALREPSVTVEAITVVAGNCPMKQAVKNALNCVEQAGTYHPPVYAGMGKPLFRDLETSSHVHGEDGMGNMHLPEADLKQQPGHAVDKIIELAHQFPGELEIVALGPLTNLAMAILKEPELPTLLKHVFIMGGAGLGPGNITPVAEFNFWVDAEAVHLVLEADMQKSLIGWDVCMDETFINREDINHLNTLGERGEFVVRCTRSLCEYNKNFGDGKDGFDLPDPTAMAVALYPDVVTTQFDSYGYVECKSEKTYGQLVIDQFNITGKPVNMTAVTKINAGMFKDKLFSALTS